jgi:hypothetical protein
MEDIDLLNKNGELKAVRKMNSIEKMFSSELKSIKEKAGRFCLENGEIHYLEVVGMVVEVRNRCVVISDPYGTIEIFKDGKCTIKEGGYSFVCKLFGKRGNILLYSVRHRKISIYEEIFFWIEVDRLRRTRLMFS